MNRTSALRKLLSLSFAAIVMYTASVRQVHFLFFHHHVQEHCDHHLHAQDSHRDCAVCNFDISIFTDCVACAFPKQTENHETVSSVAYQSIILHSTFQFYSLRSPPTLG